MLDPLTGLNDQQRQVVTTTKGPVLVLAGAGSGKTRALTHRLAYLVATSTARPEELLAVTFTNKAAKEMRQRVAKLVGPATAQAITCSTFHSLGARLLREQYQHTSRTQSFTILDTGDSERLVKQILTQQNVNPKQWSPRAIRHAISKAKNSLVSPADAAAHADSALSEIVARAYAAYQTELARHNSYDFDDLIGELLTLLRDNDSVRQHYQQRWQYVSIDEYQDTNPPQEAIIRQLLAPEPNLCVVGDDYQAIYSWRGAEVSHILRFEQNYPGCATIYLTQNYRSTPAILSAANAVIAENAEQKHKQLWTAKTTGTPVSLIAVGSDHEEARVVLQAIERHRAAGGAARDCAILYRTNAQSRLFEEGLVAAGIPYTIVGGLRFYDRAEIKDALAFLRLLVNPRDILALQRIVGVVVRGVGGKTVSRLQAAAQSQGRTLMELFTDPALLTARQRAALQPLTSAFAAAQVPPDTPLPERIMALLTASGYMRYLAELPDGREREENIEEFLSVAAGYSDLVRLVEEISLLSDIDTAGTEQDHVLCMTLHAAKGLEFKYVWLVGCEEGLLPHKNSLSSVAEMEEERRLLYVGMTRAREHLTLSYAHSRTLHGQHTPQLPSRFLSAVPSTEVERIDTTAAANVFLGLGMSSPEPATPGEAQYSSFEAGDVVSHSAFGRGVVVQTQGSTITAVFEGYGVKTFAADHAMNTE
jgi:DNA helicase II / ATP-dependent DNA helicase PcrA